MKSTPNRTTDLRVEHSARLPCDLRFAIHTGKCTLQCTHIISACETASIFTIHIPVQFLCTTRRENTAVRLHTRSSFITQKIRARIRLIFFRIRIPARSAKGEHPCGRANTKKITELSSYWVYVDVIFLGWGFSSSSLSETWKSQNLALCFALCLYLVYLKVVPPSALIIRRHR